jgi:CubicO group peptidase (beta-lactamase class C family)
LIPPGSLAQQQIESEQFRTPIEEGRAYVTDLQKRHKIPGMAVVVAVEGQIVWNESLGFADLENHVPVTRATKFRLGSVSKLLTAAAMARLYEDGLVKLDVPIQEYVPSFPSKDWAITTRQLASHTAGIRHYRDSDPIICGPTFKSVSESLNLFKDDPLIFEPGTRYEYSSFGYNLISAVIEGASRQDFLTYIRSRVFQPLGMERTVPDDPFAVVDDRTRFYFVQPDGVARNAPFVNSSFRWASGGFLATGEDLARFGMAHLNEGFFKRSTLSLLFTPQKLADGKDTGVGLGWRIGLDKQGIAYFHHGGAMEGARAFLLVRPASGVVVVMLANAFAPFGEEDALKLASKFEEAAAAKGRR